MRTTFARALSVALALVGAASAIALPKLMLGEPEPATQPLAAPATSPAAPVIHVAPVRAAHAVRAPDRPAAAAALDTPTAAVPVHAVARVAVPPPVDRSAPAVEKPVVPSSPAPTPVPVPAPAPAAQPVEEPVAVRMVTAAPAPAATEEPAGKKPKKPKKPKRPKQPKPERHATPEPGREAAKPPGSAPPGQARKRDKHGKIVAPPVAPPPAEQAADAAQPPVPDAPADAGASDEHPGKALGRDKDK